MKVWYIIIYHIIMPSYVPCTQKLKRLQVSTALHRECLQITGDGKCSGAVWLSQETTGIKIFSSF